MRFAIAVLACGVAAVAQDRPAVSTSPLPAPPDVTLRLELREQRSQYRRGELIPARWGYSADADGKYVEAADLSLLENGRSESIRCEPSELTAAGRPQPDIDLWAFLYAEEGCGVGIGGSVDSGCGDCGGFHPLGRTPISYESDLNSQVRLLRAGRYVCRVNSARVARAFPVVARRPAIELESNPLAIDVVEDPGWSRTTLSAAQAQIQASCDNAPVPADSSRWQRCIDAAKVLRFLDTDDSLRAAVRLYLGADGAIAAWQTEMWNAISQSSNRQLAITLLSQRMSDPDFVVTGNFVQTLGARRLQQHHPEAFGADVTTAHPEDYHEEAVELLRTDVRALGESLRKKGGNALVKSAATYLGLAQWHDCKNEPLIPESESREALTGLQIDPPR